MNRNRKQITFNLRCSPPPGFVFKFKNSNNSFSEDIGGVKKKKILPESEFGSERRHWPLALKTNTGSTDFSQLCKSRTLSTVLEAKP